MPWEASSLPRSTTRSTFCSSVVSGIRGVTRFAGGLPEDAGGLAVLIPVNLAALGVGGVLGDARHLQSLAVHAADVAAGADDGHGGVAAPLVQIVAGGGALFRQLALVIAPALDPLAGTLLLPHVPDGLLELLDGVDLGRRLEIFLLKSASITGCSWASTNPGRTRRPWRSTVSS